MTSPISENAAGVREFRASLGVYLIFTVIFGGLAFFLAVVLLIKNPSDIQGWSAVATCLAALAFTYYWLSRFRLVINSESIGYASMLRSFKTIRRSRIVRIDSASETNGFESIFTIVVTAESGDELRINPNVFPSEAVKALMEI